MMKCLPLREFEWMDVESLTVEDIINYDVNGDYGMVLEVGSGMK